ncbi:hypothetical protein [Aeromonas piscicola]|uniref:hypothetical protein n=1 Tax=Aeromonas piscicola TaxID=600645 RepID=UPI0021F865DD|nr:hypothetical protein [Aeromonas piscicola]MCW0503984.1 hypothetical protein [Aeromonas piscicola]
MREAILTPLPLALHSVLTDEDIGTRNDDKVKEALKPELEINQVHLFMCDMTTLGKTADKNLSATMQIKMGNGRSMINIMGLALYTIFHENGYERLTIYPDGLAVKRHRQFY